VRKIINIFSFMWMRRRNFYFFFIRISVVVSINSFFFLFKHVRIAPCWVHPILSVEADCAFAFSLGREGLKSDRLELH
jgi:hypothetical protein